MSLKLIKYILVSVLMIGMAGFISYSLKSCKFKKEVTNISNHISDTGTRWIDMYKNEHLRVVQLSGSLDAMKIQNRNEVDSLCKILKIKQKQLQGVTNFHFESNGRIVTKTDTLLLPGDTVYIGRDFKGYRFSWHDKYLSEIGFLNSDSTVVFYKMEIPASVTSYWKWKYHFLGIGFGSKITYIDVSSENKNIHITGLKSYKIN